MDRTEHQPPNERRLSIEVHGVVQGVGFRPFVYAAARSQGLSGWVRNEADVVRIEVQGDTASLEAFCSLLRNSPPPQAAIESIDVAETDCHRETSPFAIQASRGTASPRPSIPADLATCEECLAEIRTPSERRFRYPFTNCTNCGPRWSIIRAVPYDRPRTSMADFPMCDDCRREYEDPADRRFHAQPIACPRCGPSVQLLDAAGNVIAAHTEALEESAEAVLSGGVLALKGLGGFQLIVDATCFEAVARLRQRKRRPDKPLALMLRSIAHVVDRCELADRERQELVSPTAPILLLRRRADANALDDLANNVAPGNPYLGVMLPYTPLHHLLLDLIDRPIVCTSGNLSEEPMAVETDDALARLGEIADLFLVHDRPIIRPVDDSVARLGVGGVQLMRRARGYAPIPIVLGREVPAVLAVGGHLKNAVAVTIGSQAVLSPHIGDLDSVLSVEVHRRAIDDLLSFFRLTPTAIACDMHPDYASTREAERLAARFQIPVVPVQHHHAHVAACLAEHGLLDMSNDEPVLGFSWDGTGFGPDGTVWGGEMLECYGSEYRRVAHLRTFPLPGGDRAVREPRRSALGLLFEMFGAEATKYASDWFDPSELKTLLSMLDRGLNSVHTSSAGRLFDAVAAICGLPLEISFEGQAAMALEFAADPTIDEAYPLPLVEGDEPPIVADWAPMIDRVLADKAAGVPVGIISAKLHNGLARMAAAVARRWGGQTTILSGGCFQNALLAERTRQHLSAEGFRVYTHKKVPPGDGGLALGQLFVAVRRIKESSHVSGNPR